MFLFEKQKLKNLIFLNNSRIITILKIHFLSIFFNFFYYDDIIKIEDNIDSIFSICKKIEMHTMFQYLIGGYCIEKSLIVVIKKYFAILKSRI